MIPLTGTPSGTGISISCSLSWRAGSELFLRPVDLSSLVGLVSFGFFDVFSALAVFEEGAGVPCCAASDPKAKAQANVRLRENFATDAGEQTE